MAAIFLEEDFRSKSRITLMLMMLHVSTCICQATRRDVEDSTLPETNRSALENRDSYWKPPFSGAFAVSFREGT